MSKYLFDGLPPNVVTYIKVHLRRIYSTGLFDSQEREDLIQNLVLFYLELIHKLNDVPDIKIFLALKTKADHIMRTRLRELQSGFLSTRSLNDMLEDDGWEPEDKFCLADIENKIELKQLRKFLSDKQNRFIDLIFSGETVRNARDKLGISHTVVKDIEEKILWAKRKK